MDAVKQRAPLSQLLRARLLRAGLVFLLGLGMPAASLFAQKPTGCQGTADLERAVAGNAPASAWNALGAWFGSQNQLVCAAASFESAVKAAPAAWEGHFNLGLTLLNQGNAERASQELQKAAHLKPAMAQIHAALGASLSQLHRTDAAIAEFRTALRLDSKSLAALDGLAKAFILQKKYSEAVALLTHASSAATEEALQLDLAAAYSGEHNPAAAIQTLTGILQRDPSNLQAQVNLGLVYADAGRAAEAETELRKALTLSPNNASVMSSLAMVLSRLDRKADAIELMRKASALDPGSAEAHLNLGIALADEVQQDEALAEFNTAVQLAPQSAVAHYNKGRLLLDLQRNQDAKPELEASLKLAPALSDAWYLLGLIAMQAGEDDIAIQNFQKVVSLDPHNAAVHYMLGREMLNAGDKSGAIAEWRKTIEIQPQYGEALYNLARLLAKSNPAESKALESRFEQMQAQQHIMERAQTLGNFALGSAKAHDWPQAIAQLKEAITLCAQCQALPRLHKDLGLIYCHSGDFRNGRAELTAAQELTPDDDEIRKALQLLPPQ